MAFEVPKLPYVTDALEPHMDKATVEIHWGKHHQTYCTNLNKALESAPDLAKLPVEELLRDLTKVPEAIRTAVRNHGGGYANHNFWWAGMAPGQGGAPSGKIGDAINGAFGSFDKLKEQMTAKSVGHFGSGWGWLVSNKGKLEVISTPNQDSPVSAGFVPLLVVDVWEHAYYLKYQNRRADFVAAWWNLVNWDEVAKRLP
ncbi:MAG: superoxide dismutase [Candidatus Coatesbacteria bacterium]